MVEQNLGDNSSTVDIVQGARNRTDDFEVGSDRAITNPPNWNAQASQQLYDGATRNNDPGTAQATSRVWQQHSKELSQAAENLYNAISELGAAWVGQGAAAAQGTLVSIANASSTASSAAESMSTRLAKQAAAAEDVKLMPPPKEFDPAAQTAALLAGGPTAMNDDMKAQSEAADAVKAQQVAFFDRYTQAMSEVDSTTPSFAPESLGLKPFAGTGPGGYGVGSVSGGLGQVGGPSGALGPAGYGYGYGSGSGSPGSGLGSSSSSSPIDSSTSQAGYAGGAPGTGVAAGAAPAAPVAPSVPASNPAAALGAAGLGGAAGLAGRALSGGSRNSAEKERLQGSQTGAASDQPNSAASAAPQQQGMVSAAGTIGGQTPPMSGMGGMGGMGGAAGARAEEEEEHTHASFLIEADPDTTFGANEATPPPVIGAWTDDEER